MARWDPPCPIILYRCIFLSLEAVNVAYFSKPRGYKCIFLCLEAVSKCCRFSKPRVVFLSLEAVNVSYFSKLSGSYIISLETRTILF